MALSYANTDVVAPISAPMLQIVALPVADSDSAPGTEVLDDRAGAALDREDLGDLQDDVLGGRPAVELAGEVHADELRPADVERIAGHHVDRVGATDADRDHAEPARVGGVAVGADHHPAGERVLLEHDLMDDARTRLPEADAVLGRHGLEEVVDLVVVLECGEQVDLAVLARLDQVVAVHRRRHGDLGKTGGHELEQRHLRGGVLHGDSIGVEVVVGAAPLEFLRLGVARGG